MNHLCNKQCWILFISRDGCSCIISGWVDRSREDTLVVQSVSLPRSLLHESIFCNVCSAVSQTHTNSHTQLAVCCSPVGWPLTSLCGFSHSRIGGPRKTSLYINENAWWECSRWRRNCLCCHWTELRLHGFFLYEETEQVMSRRPIVSHRWPLCVVSLPVNWQNILTVACSRKYLVSALCLFHPQTFSSTLWH